MALNRKTSSPVTRVLVLEEDPGWREALAVMYRSILGRGGELTTASDAAAAERQLQAQPVDVLSLDLCLSERRGEGIDDPLLCDTGRLQLVDVAARRRWARAVVLITKAEIDGAESRFIACDRAKLDEATVSPDEFVRRRFGDRRLVLAQPARWDVPTTLARFEILIRRRLPDLARPEYTLRFGGTVYQPRVTIEAGRSAVAAFEGADALLLAALTVAGRADELVNDRSVVEIFRGRSSAHEADGAAVTTLAPREIDGLRRRLRKQGVNDRALIRRVRRSGSSQRSSADRTGSPTVTGAWRLDGAVAIEGMSNLNVRARGGQGYRLDVAASQDVES